MEVFWFRLSDVMKLLGVANVFFVKFICNIFRECSVSVYFTYSVVLQRVCRVGTYSISCTSFFF